MIPRRTASIRRSRSPTAIAASGPNSGPTTIAPTMVIGELVATPIAASRHASTMNAMNTQVSVESSPVLEMTSCQITASAAAPGALRSARRTPSPIAMSTARKLMEPRRSTPSSRRPLRTCWTHSRARSAWIRSPPGSRAAPGSTTRLVAPRWPRNTASTSSRRSAGLTTRTCSNDMPGKPARQFPLPSRGPAPIGTRFRPRDAARAGGPAMIIAGASGCTDLPRAGPKLDVGSTALGEQDLAAPGSARSLEVPLAAGHHEGPWTRGNSPGTR